MSAFLRDVRHSVRGIWRRPGLGLTSLLSLGLGIGANTAIFSILDAVALKPLPLAAPDRVFALEETRNGEPRGGNPQRMADWTLQTGSFSAIAAVYSESGVLTGFGEPAPLRVLRTFGDLAGVTGYAPSAGRLFLASESGIADAAVAVITPQLKRRLFPGVSGIPERPLTIEGRQYQVVGVLPEGPAFPADVDLWIPAPADAWAAGRKASYLFVLGRLKDGVTREGAARDLAAVQKRLGEQFPDSDALVQVSLKPLLETVAGEVKGALMIVLGLVGAVLMIACLNISCLLLARAAERERESAVRASLGSGRWGLMRLYLAESLVISMIGGAAGIAVAVFLVDLFRTGLPFELPRLSTATVDWRVAGFALALTLLCGVVNGLAPAWHASNVSLTPSMARAPRRRWLRSVLVVAEVGISLALLMGAATLVESFLRLKRQPLGYEPAQLITVSVGYPWDTPKTKLDNFYQSAAERLSIIPGVQSVGIADRLPLEGGSQGRPVSIAGVSLSPEMAKRNVSYRAVSEGYLRTLGVRLLAGAWHRPKGTVVVNETFVKTYMPGVNPIGQRMVVSPTQSFEIVGVVADLRQQAIQSRQPAEAFVLLSETYWPLGQVILRANGGPERFAQSILRELRQVDPLLIPGPVRSMEQQVGESFAQPRLYTIVLGTFALAAILLAAIGIQGVLASDVARRTQEIGIRMALGASHGETIATVMRRGLALTAAGLVLGVAMGVALTRVLSSLPVGVTQAPALPLIGAIVALTGVAAFATFLPALRAARVDPIKALRHD